jgi:hypothetical protein
MPRVASWNDASRMATIQAIVENHTFEIDDSNFSDTGDKVFIDDHFFSDKPVFPSLMGAVVYFPLFHLGIKLDDDWNLAYYLITLFTIKIFWICGIVAFYFSLKFTAIHDKYRLWLTCALAIASLHFTWSSTFNNHSLAASSLSIGFYYFLKSKGIGATKSTLFLAGLFLSIAAVSDLPMAAFYLVFLMDVIATSTLRRKTLYYLLPLLLTALPTLYINNAISGSILPMQLNKHFFEYPGSPWGDLNELSGIGINRGIFFLSYAFHSLIGSKGFLIYNPFLFIAIPALILEIKRKRAYHREATIIGITSLIIIFYYLLFTNNYGGWSYSIRWFVPLLPFLFFFMYSYFTKISRKKERYFYAFFAISLIISSVGLINPWSNETLSASPFISNLKVLVMFLNN